MMALIAAASWQALTLHTTPNSWSVTEGERTILSGNGTASIEESNRPAHDVFLGYPHGPKTSEFIPEGATAETYTLSAEPNGSDLHCRLEVSRQSFLCASPNETILGCTFGDPSAAGLNCVYDRASDVLTEFQGENARFERTSQGWSVTTNGPAKIVLRPNYYRDHLGYFLRDNSRPLWPKPVAGWCSWAAYGQQVTPDDMLAAAKFFGENLKEYGYNIIQIDDGFQRSNQSGDIPLKPGETNADRWTIPNGKFSKGLGALAQGIKAYGLTPGIWFGLYLSLGVQPDAYTRDPDGNPHRGPWVNYAVNGLDQEAVDNAYVDPIRIWKKQGWDYFKIDTLRHVLYDNYRKVPEYWAERHEQMEAAYRNIFRSIKEAAGPKTYVLACWGTLPELAGLPNGCRIGEDVGPDFDSMRRTAKYIAQFSYLNDVVWRNDPDYMCLRLPNEQDQTWATMNALAGGQLMVSDPIADYDSAKLSILRKVGPPMMLHPMNMASLPPDPEFMTLHAEKNGESWTVAARFAWKPVAESSFDGNLLGLDPSKSYLAFDFWKSKFLGIVRGKVGFQSLDEGQCQVISYRPLLDHPQVLGTDRHIGQGVAELDEIHWDGSTLSGKMLLGHGEQWSLYLYVPAGFRVASSSDADRVLEGNVLRLRFPDKGGWRNWSVRFSL